MDPRACGHQRLEKVDASGVNDVDTDVLVYLCSSCGKTFTVTDL
jgi:DNA-directed RNA polymerase subunit RPC12/RpoP